MGVSVCVCVKFYKGDFIGKFSSHDPHYPLLPPKIRRLIYLCYSTVHGRQRIAYHD